MLDIRIRRYADDPTAQGVIVPADESWQLVIGADGTPHLYLRINVEPDEPGGEMIRGWLAIDDVLPPDGQTRDLMRSTFGGKLSPEEEVAAYEEICAQREVSPVPCPR